MLTIGVKVRAAAEADVVVTAVWLSLPMRGGGARAVAHDVPARCGAAGVARV